MNYSIIFAEICFYPETSKVLPKSPRKFAATIGHIVKNKSRRKQKALEGIQLTVKKLRLAFNKQILSIKETFYAVKNKKTKEMNRKKL